MGLRMVIFMFECAHFSSMFSLFKHAMFCIVLHFWGCCIRSAAFPNCTVTADSAACVWRSMLFYDSCQLHTKQTGMSVFSLLSLFTCHFSASLSLHVISSHLQASNGNDPWSVWNSDPSGGSNNNWASNPEGTQTGKSAPDPWGSVSQGHPQAYQGPGEKKLESLQPLLMSEKESESAF